MSKTRIRLLSITLLVSLVAPACAHESPPSRSIHFESDKAEPQKSEDYVTIGRALATMDLDPELRLLIVGHTDADGSIEHNRKLAFDRARQVKSLLLDSGPNLVNRVELAFFGMDRPIADNATDEGKAKNRRVELYFYYPKSGTTNEVKLQSEFGGRLEFDASASASIN